MNTDKLDRFLDEMPLRGLPGCDLSVTRNGREVYRRTVGYSDAEMKRPVDRDTLWWIFSATKVITCTAAMRLVEEGRLKLTDKVIDNCRAMGVDYRAIAVKGCRDRKPGHHHSHGCCRH